MDSSAIEIRPLQTPRELNECVELQQATWGREFTDIVPASILKVAQRVGGVVGGAFGESGDLLGFVFGLTGVERGKIVHWSDMLAVRPDARNLGLGRRLKEYQRTAVREMGCSVIYWTYDPLVARNAHLNFNRLGVRLAEYVEDFYGVTDSVLHGGIPTDRLVVAWPTRDDEIDQLLANAERAVESLDCQQSPIVTPDFIDGADGAAILPHCVRVEIPADAEGMLRDAPQDAASWRSRVRRNLRWALNAGYTITALSNLDGKKRGYYLMTKAARAGEAGIGLGAGAGGGTR
ncbi:MAG: GNAT family N-acetyltransferase [Gemmatimonadaceae bacterium]